MSRRVSSSLLVALIVLVWAPSAYPKGSPDQITITGGGLPCPIVVTDGETLEAFDPWRGQFINWQRDPVGETPHGGEPYAVFFYLQSQDGDLRMIYALQYIPGRRGGRGYVYLPGEGERYYALNVGTISRTGADGKWNSASAKWDALLKRVLTAKGSSGTGPSRR
jgi:hypothetical protein